MGCVLAEGGISHVLFVTKCSWCIVTSDGCMYPAQWVTVCKIYSCVLTEKCCSLIVHVCMGGDTSRTHTRVRSIPVLFIDCSCMYGW